MTRIPLSWRTLAVVGILSSMLALFVFVALRSGPLAPVAVTVAAVESRALSPELFGIGTVESRFRYHVGPTAPGRVLRLLVDVGDRVVAGQLMGEMDPVDLDGRIRAQEAARRRSDAVLQEGETRQQFARMQATRYEQLLAARSTSEEMVAAKQHERDLASAALTVAQEEVARASAELEVLLAQRKSLRLISPVDGRIAARDVDPGTTVVAGQAVLEVVDPGTVWINVRFDQSSAHGLQPGQAAQVVLRSRAGQPVSGRVARLELRADAITEEMLVKVSFAGLPSPLPPIGELAEVSVSLPPVAAAPVIPNAAVQRFNGTTGVWQLVDGDLRFTAVSLGVTDLDGRVQVTSGLTAGDRIVVYSASSLSTRSRIQVVDRIGGVGQ